MKDMFVIWRGNVPEGVMEGDIHELLRMLETNFKKGCYLEPWGFTLSDGRKVIRLGDYDEYIKQEQALNDYIDEYMKRSCGCTKS